jgi:23S rRNA pseudouridine1911/1915/1917 synthase
MAIVPPDKGRAAISEYTTLRTYSGYTLLDVHPITGRTHQIRVHLAFLGCPVAGDQVYGRKHQVLNLERQFLHAWRLKIQLPGETIVSTFEAELPSELQNILDQLEAQK